MGCCAANNESISKDRNVLKIDFNKRKNPNINDTIPTDYIGEKGTLSIESARSFFKQKTTVNNDKVGGDADKFDISLERAKNEKIGKEEAEFREKRNNEEEKQRESIIKFPRLEIVFFSQNALEKEKIIITPNSINGIMKTIGDKFFFGKEQPSKLTSSLVTLTTKNTILKQNDYNFLDDAIGPRQFEISYSKEKQKYYIMDDKRGTGLFVKVINKIKVDHDMIVSFCSSHMILHIENEAYHPENKIIRIRILQNSQRNLEKVFNSKDKKLLRIGRSKNAEIVYKDDSISRIQCTIVFENGEWNLYDGYPDNGNKGSTNGLWLLASNKMEMHSNMIIKTGNTTMAVNICETEHV